MPKAQPSLPLLRRAAIHQGHRTETKATMIWTGFIPRVRIDPLQRKSRSQYQSQQSPLERQPSGPIVLRVRNSSSFQGNEGQSVRETETCDRYSAPYGITVDNVGRTRPPSPCWVRSARLLSCWQTYAEQKRRSRASDQDRRHPNVCRHPLLSTLPAEFKSDAARNEGQQDK